MRNENKLSKMEIALYLKEALQQFCEKETELRPALAEPFRQKDKYGFDYVMASNGYVLISIKAKAAGVAVSPFGVMDEFDALKSIPFIGFEERLESRMVCRKDICRTIDKMQKYEAKRKKIASADLGGVQLSMEGLSHIEVAMRICGAERACLVYHKEHKVALQIYNNRSQDAVTILQMGWLPKDSHIITVPTEPNTDDVFLDWRKGMESWQIIKAELERKDEEERMARRQVYMVEVIKRAFIPVYAKTAEEAQSICDNNFMEPEDDGDDEWMLGDSVPEAEDLDDIGDCYKHVLTRDGEVERDEIYEMDQISEEWHKNHKE